MPAMMDIVIPVTLSGAFEQALWAGWQEQPRRHIAYTAAAIVVIALTLAVLVGHHQLYQVLTVASLLPFFWMLVGVNEHRARRRGRRSRKAAT